MQLHVLLDVQYLLEAEAEARWILVGLMLCLMLCILELFCCTCQKQQIKVSQNITYPPVYEQRWHSGNSTVIALCQCGPVLILAWCYI